MKALHRVPFRIAAFAAAIRDSYWFVPALLAAAGLVAGVALVTLDARLGETWLSESMLLHGSRPEGARAMLSTIAGSTITVAGVVFSITLAAVTYTLASAIHVSGPVAMAVAGLVIGNSGVALAMSDITRDYLLKFWSLIDDILNAVLFLLIGLEVVTIPQDWRLIVLGVAAIPLVLIARAISVLGPLLAMRPFLDLGALAPITLIWGGLRGGISIALVLALPDGPARSVTLAATYVIVLFSVIVQGGTIERLLDWQSSRLARRSSGK